MASISIEIDAVDKASGILGNIFSMITQGANAFDLASAAAAVTASFIADSTQAAFEYAQEIKGISDATGLSAEATSRLVQAMDDVGIGSETVKKALKAMAKDGIEPNVQELAALSDEFLTLNTGAEKGKFLMEHFGKAGEDMARAMALGGDAILALNDGVSENLVLTEDAIQQAEEYRQNVDELNDSWQGVKITLGNAVIPVINEQVAAQQQANSALQQAYNELGGVSYRLLEVRAAEITATQASRDAYAARMEGLASLYETTNATSELGTATALTADQIKEMNTVNTGQLSLVQKLQDVMTNYNETLAETTEKYGENSQEVQDLQAEHEQAMKQIAYDLYLAKLQADGLTDAEFQIGLQAGVSAGLLDQATVDMALAFDATASAAVEAGGTTGAAFIEAAGQITDAQSAAEILGGTLDDIAHNYEITVTTTWENIGDASVGHILTDFGDLPIEYKSAGKASGGGYASPMTNTQTISLSPETIRLLAAAMRQEMATIQR